MDTHLFPGYEVPPFYDSLLGKLIVWGPDRPTAIARSLAPSRSWSSTASTTNVAIHQALLRNEVFLAGRMTTNLVDRVGARLVPCRRRSLRGPGLVLQTCTESAARTAPGRAHSCRPTWSCR